MRNRIRRHAGLALRQDTPPPSREEIDAALAEIHAGWSERRRRNRHAMAEFQVRYKLTPLVTRSRH
jgi:hypothetical protein